MTTTVDELGRIVEEPSYSFDPYSGNQPYYGGTVPSGVDKTFDPYSGDQPYNGGTYKPGGAGTIGAGGGITSGITSAINDLFGSNLSGEDLAKRFATVGGGLAGAMGAFNPKVNKSGYQGSIPKYTATRNMVTAPPAGSRPGAGGVNYGGDVTYTPRAGATPSSPSGGSSGGGGSSALGNIAKVAGSAGLAALLGNYLSKSGGGANVASILKGITGGSGNQPYKPSMPTLSPTEDEGNVTNPVSPPFNWDEDMGTIGPKLPEFNWDEDMGADYTQPSGNYEWYDYAKGGVAGVDNPRYLQGETDGMADKIPARIGHSQPAALSHGEFVVPADVVSHLGNGNSDAGAKKLYQMMDKIREARTGTTKQGKKINPDKFMPGGLASAYAKGGKVMKFAGPTGSAVPAGLTGTDQAPASWAGEYITDMLGKGQALSEAPYQQYGGPLTAGASNLQQQAFNTAGNLSVPGSVGAAAQTAGDIANKAQNTSYNPTQFDSQFKAPELSAATQFTNQFKAPDAYQNTTFKSGTFGQDQAQQYMNPYLQSSLNPQLEEARRQSNISEQANKAAMTKAGAFGGGRGAILTAENQRNLGTNLAGITGKGYDTAYQNAMSQFNADQARNLQAQQASEQSKQFGASQGMTAADMMAKYGMSAQQAQEAARQFNQGQAMTGAQSAAQYGQAANQASEQSRQFGADLGLKGLQTGLQAAQTQGNLGISGGQLGLAQLQEQAALGGQQRGIEAEGIAADKAAFEQARDNPYKMVQFQQSLLNGLPITAQNYNYQQPDWLTNAAGGATTVNKLLDTLGLGSSGGAASPKK